MTLLFDRDQYLAAADAYLRGLERRVADGLAPDVCSVASLFMSRWDGAVQESAPEALRGKLALAVGGRAFKAYRDLLRSDRMLRLMNLGARPQRLLWASTSTKDPSLPDTLYVDGLFAPFTVNTLPDSTLQAVADHGALPERPLPEDGVDAEEVLDAYEKAGIDVDALAAELQRKGADAFVDLVDGAARDDRLQARGARRARRRCRPRGSTSCRRSRALREHAGELRGRALTELFAADGERAAALSAEACGLLADFSKQRITPQTLDLLAALAEQAGLPQRIEAMLAGERDQRLRGPARAAHRAARAARRADRGRRRGRRRPRARGARADGGVRRAGARRRVARRRRRADRAPWSTSASAARTWGRRWRRWRSPRTRIPS